MPDQPIQPKRLARERIEAAVAPFVASNTARKRAAQAVLDEFKVTLADGDDGRPYVVLVLDSPAVEEPA